MQEPSLSSLAFYIYNPTEYNSEIATDYLKECFVNEQNVLSPITDGSDNRNECKKCNDCVNCIDCSHYDLYVVLSMMVQHKNTSLLKINRDNICKVLLKYTSLRFAKNTELVRTIHHLVYSIILLFIAERQIDLLAFSIENSILDVILYTYTGVSKPARGNTFIDRFWFFKYKKLAEEPIKPQFTDGASSPYALIYMSRSFAGLVDAKTEYNTIVTILLLISGGLEPSPNDFNYKLTSNCVNKYRENNKRVVAVLGLYRKNTHMNKCRDILRIIAKLTYSRRIIDCARLLKLD